MSSILDDCSSYDSSQITNPKRIEKFKEAVQNFIKKSKPNRCLVMSLIINLIALTALTGLVIYFHFYRLQHLELQIDSFSNGIDRYIENVNELLEQNGDLMDRNWKLSEDNKNFQEENLELLSQQESYFDDLQELKKLKKIPKNCFDLKFGQKRNVSSGWFFIRLERENLDSFQVYCDFEKDLTIIKPVTKQIEIGALENIPFGNQITEVQYDASLDEIRALIGQSGSCYQTLHFDCFQMPLQSNNTNHAWWKDFKGHKNYFFDGSNAKVRQCSNQECNCNFAKPGVLEWKFDNGKITADWLLPITGFGYEESLSLGANRAMRVIIGDVVCQNQVSIKIDGYLKDALLPDKYLEKVQTVQSQIEGLNIKVDFEVTEWNRTIKQSSDWIEQPCPDIFHIKYHVDWTGFDYYSPRVYYCYSQNTLKFYGFDQNNYLYDSKFEVSIADLQQEHEVISHSLPSKYSRQFVNVTVTKKTVTLKVPLDGEQQGDERVIFFASLEDYGILLSNLTITEI